LKPANIKIGPDGRPKILDFGLAKALVRDTEDATDLSRSPTLAESTEAGRILGTASYMSPEQARGQTLDKRTDIWSLGCCLFEALTGRRAFTGKTLTDVLAAVLSAEPDFSCLPENVPAAVQRALRRCLRKDPSRRLHDVADLRIELEEARDGEADRSRLPSPDSSRKPFVVAAGWAFAATVAASWLWWAGAGIQPTSFAAARSRFPKSIVSTGKELLQCPRTVGESLIRALCLRAGSS
jgi:serine/threonine protein kinase